MFIAFLGIHVPTIFIHSFSLIDIAYSIACQVQQETRKGGRQIVV